MLDQNKIFQWNDFGDAKGGTEIMVEGLLKHVDNDLLSKFDIVVSYPPVSFEKNPNKKSILWLHDLPTDKYLYDYLSVKSNQEKFDYFVFVSFWQKEMFRVILNLPDEKCVVMRNCIEPQDVDDSKWNNISPIKLVYSSTPQRGLNILFEVFKVLKTEYNIELNVFSSFDIYGEKHKSRNEPYKSFYEELRNTEGINYYGSVDHERLLKELKSQHIFCLPSTWEETSCISLLEAMSSECFCVHSDLAALPETSSNFTKMYKFYSNPNVHANYLYYSLKSLIDLINSKNSKITSHLLHQKYYIDGFYSWNVRKDDWTAFLDSIL